MLKPQTINDARAVPATRLPCFVFELEKHLARQAAAIIASVINERNALGQSAVLGLPTGLTAVGMYRELIRLHQEEGLDFSNVITFNLDEYFGLDPAQPQSYSHWVHSQLLDHVNIPPEHINIPDGSVPLNQVKTHCRDYEAKIDAVGGIDVVVLGVGRNGHIAFNEPYCARSSRTRLVTLDSSTRTAAASNFFGKENVPTHAITMGVATILDTRKVLLLAQGEHKAKIVCRVLEKPVSDEVPASYLQQHDDAMVLLDAAAAAKLVGQATPWAVSEVAWTRPLIKRAVLWLCEQTGKALLKLADGDFRQHHLVSLLREHGPAPKLAHRVFKWMMETIEYHPGGREPKRVICFSPHPDDDVISMGGTLIRLVEDRHEVHIAYMTSGNIAVFDHDAHRIADLVTEYNRMFGIDEENSKRLEADVHRSLTEKRPGDFDAASVLKIKGLIRWSEAKAGAMEVGCQEKHLHFLDLPFYRTGTVTKHPVGSDDVRIIRELIETVAPEQIYVAGDLSDPHGTHRVCADAIFRALAEIEHAGGSRPDVLLYRGAWQEYALDEIEIAVPLSPSDLERKRKAVFKHESQKDEALFPGSDSREFWERAEDRNCGTADKYNQIGLPEYFALEAFVEWKGLPI
jgi:glucosamine-6-phosphate deaminase